MTSSIFEHKKSFKSCLNQTAVSHQLAVSMKQKMTVKLACCWLAAADAVPTELGVELAAVMTPPVILNVVVPGLDKCPAAAVTVFTEPSDSFTCAPWELPTTCTNRKVEVGIETHEQLCAVQQQQQPEVQS